MLRLVLVATLLCLSNGVANAERRIPFWPKKQKYTPLLFFKLPRTASPENDAMEKVVAEVEKELGVRVERLDVMRDPMVQKTYGMLAGTMPPFLYHRESRQTVSVPSSEMKRSGEEEEDEEEGATGKSAPVKIDKDRVRAWAKGRYLPPPEPEKNLGVNIFGADENAALDQQELLEDQQLTPLQREGKENIKKRTKEKAEERRRRSR